MRSHFTILNGHPFHYRSWGDEGAPVLLLLHGFPEYSGAWSEVAERLAGRFHCIAPDQRGYGQSWAPADPGKYALSYLVADMAALIGELGAPVAVAGHDWGAAVAYGLAMFTPHLVERLIVINGVHPAPFQRALLAGGAQTEASQYIHLLRAEGAEDRLSADGFALLLKLFSARMDLSWLHGARLEAYKTEWSRPGRMRAMVNWYRASPLVVPVPGRPSDKPPALPADRLNVACPHLLIWGEADTALLPESFAGLEDYARDLTIHRVPDADHWICHQKPDAVAGTITGWLERA